MSIAKVVKLGEIADVNWGDTSVTKASYVTEGFPAFSATGCDGFLPYADFDREAIVLSAIGARAGKTWFVDGKWSCIKNTIRFWSTSDQVHNRYLYWATVGEEVWPKRGAAQPFITIGDARQLVIPLPDLEQQRRIAAILDQAETLRTQRRAALAQLDSLTQYLFLDMFGDPATNPNSWPVKTLKELGKVITGGTPPSSKEGMFDGPIPFVTPGDLESDQPVRRSITEAGAREVDLVRAGSTLVCCIGATIGKVGMAQKESAFNQQLNAVVWGNDINDHFGYEVMRFFKPTIISWGASTTLPILKKSSFERIEIPVPPLLLQEAFANRLKEISKLKGLHKSALLALDELFGALQSKAFAGEL